MYIKLFSIALVLFSIQTHAQTTDTDTDSDPTLQPALAAPADRFQMPAGFELVTAPPRIIGYGFKAKGMKHVISLACVGTGTPARCNRVRHIVSLDGTLRTYFFGPIYQVIDSNTEPTDAQIKSTAKELNRRFKNHRFSPGLRYSLIVVGGMGLAMFVPAIGAAAFWGTIIYASSDKSGQPILPGAGKVASMANKENVKWPNMKDRIFIKYMNFIQGGMGTSFQATMVAEGKHVDQD